ncbi:MAG: hypothetical protein GYB36_03130 [Alphaproteobacteria bacterium]|nr:hypothetical protein [Alphaproteobacteria bacterium]
MRSILALSLAAGLTACSVTEEDRAEGEAAEAETAQADTTPPGTDIYTYALSWEDELPVLGEAIAVVGSPGYDNQPYFLEPDEAGSVALLYTSAGDNGETDIWYRELTSGDSWPITDTPDASEYSPRQQRGGGYSYIYQPPGGYAGHAHLEEFDYESNSRVSRPTHDLGPVGYYVFSDDLRHVAVFALGEPNTLQLINRTSEPETVTHIADNPGRTLTRAPYDLATWFSVADSEGNHTVSVLDFESGRTEALFALPPGSQDFAAINLGDGGIGFFSTDSGVLVYRDSRRDWTPIADIDALGLTGVTRIAVDYTHSVIAVVAEE